MDVVRNANKKLYQNILWQIITHCKQVDEKATRQRIDWDTLPVWAFQITYLMWNRSCGLTFQMLSANNKTNYRLWMVWSMMNARGSVTDDSMPKIRLPFAGKQFIRSYAKCIFQYRIELVELAVFMCTWRACVQCMSAINSLAIKRHLDYYYYCNCSCQMIEQKYKSQSTAYARSLMYIYIRVSGTRVKKC